MSRTKGPCLRLIGLAIAQKGGHESLSPAIWIWDVTPGAMGMEGVDLSLLGDDETFKKWDGSGAREFN